METKQAILSFSQSEKVKSGLIWCSQSVQIIENIPATEQAGGLKLLQAMMGMIANEVQLAAKLSGDPIWLEVYKNLNNARVMIESGVVEEAPHHFTLALTQVNRVGQKSMTALIEKGLLS